MNPSTADEKKVFDDENLFSAFRKQQRVSRRRWLYAAAVPLLAAVAAWASMQGKPNALRVVTPNGIRVVNPGMTQQEVFRLLGQPIGRESRAGGVECFHHGQFSLNEPVTTIYLACYEGGHLRDVTPQRYAMWMVDPSGEFIPAGVQFGSGAEPEKAAAPTATP